MPVEPASDMDDSWRSISISDLTPANDKGQEAGWPSSLDSRTHVGDSEKAPGFQLQIASSVAI